MRRRYRVYCPGREHWRTAANGTRYRAWCSFDSHRKAESPEAAVAKPCPQCGGSVLIHPGDPAYVSGWSKQ
jgi:hypothetical protein